jgi:hypothetical protein
MEFKSLQGYLKRSFYWGLARSFAKGAFRTGTVVPLIILVSSASDYFFEWPRSVRMGMWFGTACVGLGLWATGFFPLSSLSLKRRSSQLSKSDPSHFRDDELVIARDLLAQQEAEKNPGGLKNAYLESVNQQLAGVSLNAGFATESWPKRAIGFLLSLGLLSASWFGLPPFRRSLAHILFPFSSAEFDSNVKILPGDADVPVGADVEIDVSLLISALDKPSLSIRSNSGWMALKPSSVKGSQQLFSIRSISEQVDYRVLWRGERSKTFKLTPVKLIQITSFNILVTPPLYLESPDLKTTSPAIEGLPGSRIKIDFELSERVEKAQLILNSGTVVSVEHADKGRYRAQFDLSNSGEYRVEAWINGQWRAIGDRYPIVIKNDGPPAITLVSPDQDLVVGVKEEIPLTYESTDDVGLGKIILEWQLEGETVQSKPVQFFGPDKKSVFATFNWDLSPLKLRSGSVLRYRLSALDRNSVSGPGQGTTRWAILEIQNFKKTHETIEKELLAWREEIIDVLAQANLLEKKISGETGEQKERQDKAAALKEASQSLESHLNRILTSMETDPLMDAGVYAEHRAMGENLNTANQTLLPELEQKISQMKTPEARQTLRDFTSELERMAGLSEKLMKDQNVQNIRQSSDELESMGDRLLESLETKARLESKLSKEDQAKIESLLAEAEEILSEIAKSIQNSPQDYPEDFINQDAVKKMDFAEPQSLLEEIQKAMAKGDFNQALALARQFQSAAKKLREQLSKAHEESQTSSGDAQLEKSIRESQEKLDQIIQDQMDVLGRTQKLETKNRAEDAARWADRFKILAERQKNVVEKAEGALLKEGNAPAFRAALSAQRAHWTGVLKELTDKKVEKSPGYLDEIITGLSQAVQIGSSENSAGLAELEWIIAEEKEIRAELTKPMPRPASGTPDTAKEFQALKTRQGSLQAQSSDLKKKLQTLSRESALLGLPLTQALGAAGAAMGKASEALGEEGSREALVFEEEALQYLLDGQSQMQQAASGTGENGTEGPGSQGSGRRMTGRSRSGSSGGAKTEPVRLPRADEFRSPKAFREELLKGLKERYPQIYEDVIQKYYKRLTD